MQTLEGKYQISEAGAARFYHNKQSNRNDNKTNNKEVQIGSASKRGATCLLASLQGHSSEFNKMRLVLYYFASSLPRHSHGVKESLLKFAD